MTTAEACCVASATLVAVTVTVDCPVMQEGAVYKPVAVIVPIPGGLIAQVTGVLPTENCCVWETVSVTLAGVTLRVTVGASVTVAIENFVVSAWLVAFTVTVC